MTFTVKMNVVITRQSLVEAENLETNDLGSDWRVRSTGRDIEVGSDIHQVIRLDGALFPRDASDTIKPLGGFILCSLRCDLRGDDGKKVTAFLFPAWDGSIERFFRGHEKCVRSLIGQSVIQIGLRSSSLLNPIVALRHRDFQVLLDPV